MNLSDIIDNWKSEILGVLNGGNAVFIACFSNQGEILYANDAMSFIYKNSPSKSFINPSFDYILNDENNGQFFDGVITFGEIHSSENFSIIGKLLRNNDKILLLGELNIQELIDQNKIIRELNHENVNLNRLLIQEKNQLKISQKELKESKSNLVQLNATKDKFFSIIAHDLINPVGAFKTVLNMLSEEYHSYSEIERKEWIDKISIYADNSYELLVNLLEWSRSQRGILKTEMTNFYLNEVIIYTINMLRSQADAKNINIFFDKNLNLYINSDIALLRTIIRNIVSNAIKFTPRNGSILIINMLEDENIILKIKDTGIGMKEETLQSLFRIDNHNSTKGTDDELGTGLGLILSKEFADRLNIDIKIESKVNIGTTFILSIPKAKPYQN
jgi:signal transduction histidine kinase